MIVKPALKVPVLLVTLFLLIIGIVIGGSLWYRQAVKRPANTITETTTEVNNIPAAPIREAARLVFIPVDDSLTTYRVVVQGLSQPTSGLVFQIFNRANSPQIISNAIATDQNLQANGWETAINSSTQTDSTQELSFSLLISSPTESELVETINIGTLTFDDVPSISQLTLNEEESYVIYQDSSIAPLNFVLETDTMENESL